jgi:hypothetical protein
MTLNGGGQSSLFIFCVTLNAKVCCNWSSKRLEYVWKPLICLVTYVENLEWKLNDAILAYSKKDSRIIFRLQSRDQEKRWAPHISCGACANMLKTACRNRDNHFALRYWWYSVIKKSHQRVLFLFDQCERLLCKIQAWHSVLEFALGKMTSPSWRFSPFRRPKWLGH